MKELFIYPAIFETGSFGVAVVFPDLPGCVTQNDNYKKAFKGAQEALNLHLRGMLEDGDPFPEPSILEDIPLRKHEALALIETQI